ncbi:MAG: acetyl-CoA C-acyltransferase [bacterium]|nr:acetyl-CoA C-acyltransferase [bacterium]
MEHHPEAVIVGIARTPIGAYRGSLSSFSATQLGGIAIRSALERAHISPDQVQDVIMGMVLQAGVGQAPARQASIAAGIPTSASAWTVNKVCSSGLKAIMLAAAQIESGESEVVVAGGMESMSNTPHYVYWARSGVGYGHAQVIDGVIKDGLWDVYNDKHMGNCAETCAAKYNITREQQDEYAKLSYTRALEAQKNGYFSNEIVPVTIPQKKGDPIVINEDEEPKKAKLDKFAELRPAFAKDGTVTAANASSLDDGAAALVLVSRDYAIRNNLKILASVKGWSTFSQDPEWFTTAPSGAVERLLKKLQWSKDEVDYYELNEAFSVVALVNNQLLGLPSDKVNIWGGAVALGHPIGASGARIVVTLLSQLLANGKKRGIAGLCNGGGEATALAIQTE